MRSAQSRLRRPIGGFLIGAAFAALIVTGFTGASLVLVRNSLAVGSVAPDLPQSSRLSRLTLAPSVSVVGRRALLG
jgi:hypothetical protein